MNYDVKTYGSTLKTFLNLIKVLNFGIILILSPKFLQKSSDNKCYIC